MSGRPARVLPLRSQVLRHLVEAATWVPRRELDPLTTCRLALDDVLAELVVQKRVEFRPAVGYRLAGDLLVRRAMQSMQREGSKRAVCALQAKGQIRAGVAQVVNGVAVAYLVELPPAETAVEQLAQARRFAEFCAKHLMDGVGNVPRTESRTDQEGAVYG